MKKATEEIKKLSEFNECLLRAVGLAEKGYISPSQIKEVALSLLKSGEDINLPPRPQEKITDIKVGAPTTVTEAIRLAFNKAGLEV